MTNRRNFLATASLGVTIPFAFSQDALAQSASKATRLIVPFPAGGGTDAVARMMASRLATEYPTGLLVDNRPGAAGRLGVEYVKDIEPDGKTILFTTDFTITMYPFSYRKLNYSPLQDFMPVASCGGAGYAIVAGPGLPANVNNIQQFTAWAKANPKLASFASTSAGSGSHFIGIMLSRAIGAELLHVPYKGGAPALQDLMGGQIPVSINPIGEVVPQLNSGKVRVLATTGAQRSRFLPDAPTLVEAGFKDMVIEFWVGAFMPAKTPVDIVNKTAALFNSVLQKQELKDGFRGIGMETAQGTPASFTATIKSDMERWGPVIKAAGFTAED